MRVTRSVPPSVPPSASSAPVLSALAVCGVLACSLAACGGAAADAPTGPRPSAPAHSGGTGGGGGGTPAPSPVVGAVTGTWTGTLYASASATTGQATTMQLVQSGATVTGNAYFATPTGEQRLRVSSGTVDGTNVRLVLTDGNGKASAPYVAQLGPDGTTMTGAIVGSTGQQYPLALARQ